MSLNVQIPPPQTPFLNQDGTVSMVWLTFLNALVTRAGGISGYQPAANNLDGLASLNASAGIVVQTGAATFTKRTLAGIAGRTVITVPDGATGSPTVDLAPVAGVAGVHASPTSLTIDGYGRVTAIS
jgi:hypothetical protein